MRALGIILAGGKNERLKALTKERALAAMPVAGSYRAIDFALSNMANSGVNKVAVVTQYNSRSLVEHLSSSKWWDFGRKHGGLYIFTPYLTYDNSLWYRGTADAIHQNLEYLNPVAVTLVALLAREGDPLLIGDDVCSFYLISDVEEDLFDGYFPLAGIDRETEQDFRNLKRALELGGILSESLTGDNRYFRGYREILELQNEADQAMESALKMRRQAMVGDEDGALREAGDRYPRIYDELTGRIQEREAALDRLPQSEQKEGEELIFRYLDAREEVADIWTGISPRYRSLARLVFNELDEDIEDIIKDVSRESF